MYNIQEISQTIKDECKRRGVSVKKVLVDCGLSKSTVSNMSDGRMTRVDTVAIIADYLNCSVDYLLGRKSSQSFTIENSGDNVGVVGQSNAPITIHSTEQHSLTIQEQDFLRIYNKADGKTQMQIMNFMYDIEDKMKRKE